MMKSAIQILKVSGIMGIMTSVLNVTLFSLYPKYLFKEEMNIRTLESEFIYEILNVKNLLFYFVAWIIITGIYFLAAKFGLKKLYRTIIVSLILLILIIKNSSMGYSLHLLGYVLFIIFSLVTFFSFYFLIENEISKSNLKNKV